MATAAELRSGVTALTTLANADLAALWRQVSTAAQAREALRDILPALVETYGSAAATLAADWYDEARLKAGIGGSFTAIPAEIGDAGTDELARWGVDPLFKAEPDWVSAQSLIQGGLQRRIANVSRVTVAESSIADPSADGWQRTGSGECAFCAMLIGRGAVYSESTADFASHDHCNCAAVPAFRGLPRPVKPYTPSDKNITDADRERVSAYLRGEDASTSTRGDRRKSTSTDKPVDIDGSRTVAQLRETLAQLERSLAKFESPGTRARVEDLRRKVAARS